MTTSPQSGSLRLLRRQLITGLLLIAGLFCATSSGAAADALVKGKTVVVLGDSITKGVRTGVAAEEIFSARLQKALNDEGVDVVVNNQGIGGERTDQALKRLNADVLSQKPAIVVMMYGTNDSYIDIGRSEPRITADAFEANLREIVRQLESQGTRVVLMTAPRWGDKATPNGAGENPNSQLEKYLERTRMVAESGKLPLIDHYKMWSDARTNGQNISTWMTDECHPNPEGHRQLADAILPILRKELSR